MNDQNEPILVNAREAGSKVQPTATSNWQDILLATLPFLLILLADGLPKLLVQSGLLAWDDTGMQILNAILMILLIASILVVFILAWRRRWPTWAATWYPIFCIPVLLLAVGLSSLLMQGQLDFTISQDVVIFVWIPLGIAILLYAATRLDPVSGLLAALPVIYALWQTNMEFVPDGIELTIKVPSILLICLTVGYLIRRADWCTGLYATLGTNFVVGALFAFTGIYYGGTLPFEASGPNLVEVMRSFIPQYLATCAILLGPLFAWRFRQAGRSAGHGGKIAYHLGLAGLLVVIMANLAGLSLTMQINAPSQISNKMAPLVVLGLGAYLAGVAWLYRYWTVPKTVSGWAEGIMLPLLPLGIPVALMLPFITWKWPVSNLYGIPLLWELPHAVSLSIGLVWLGLSVWVITRQGVFFEPQVQIVSKEQSPPKENQPEEPDRSA
jgi:hypothetical protein